MVRKNHFKAKDQHFLTGLFAIPKVNKFFIWQPKDLSLFYR
ncbi:hypothetical protein A33Q_2466 [Indibacter alkaliphilus LW1]|uniref:Uncharacterized protein n=1 Tax=Indibacter alkaliphilus (strain CCUG 57479 / KCTC 22604 / LW1) TaxID=1189612 RepID=S2DGV2_INDAL|nr:hypothetical protein A33Q_2466 [Indibacter alkaliphilus LW1]